MSRGIQLTPRSVLIEAPRDLVLAIHGLAGFPRVLR